MESHHASMSHHIVEHANNVPEALLSGLLVVLMCLIQSIQITNPNCIHDTGSDEAVLVVPVAHCG